jgi:hypothetical protein
MGTLGAIVTGIVRLFVDDGSLALALLAWCALVGLAPLLLPGAIAFGGPALFVGCAGILLVNVARAGRRKS